MRYLKALILLLVLQACTVSTPVQPPAREALTAAPAGQPWECVDTLAGVTYPDEVSAIPLDVGVGYFAKAFGDAYDSVKHQLEIGRKFVRVHLIWSDTHSYGPSDIAFIKSESARYNSLCKLYPGRVFISPLTEHNIKDPGPYTTAVTESAPYCIVVNNPWNGGYSSSASVIQEVHGNHSLPKGPWFYAHSDDGTQSVDTNFTQVKAKWSGALYNCVWGRSHNLRTNTEDDASRPERIAQASWRKPSKDYNTSHVYLLENRRGATKVPKNWIVKSHADMHQADPKSNHTVIIASVAKTVAGKHLPIELKRNGKTVCTAKYYGTYDSQRGFHRYYLSDYGYKCGEGLDMFFNKQKYGTISPGWRDGTKYYN